MKITQLLGDVCACLLCIAVTPTFGSVVYTYTGNFFDTFTTPSSYTTSMAVTGTVELAAPLGTNMFREFVTPLSFSFNDGINTISDINASSLRTFLSFSTDASGVITDWEINIEQGYQLPTNIGDTNFRMLTNGPNAPLLVDSGIIFTCTLINQQGGCDSSVQDWGVAAFTPAAGQ